MESKDILSKKKSINLLEFKLPTYFIRWLFQFYLSIFGVARAEPPWQRSCHEYFLHLVLCNFLYTKRRDFISKPKILDRGGIARIELSCKFKVSNL